VAICVRKRLNRRVSGLPLVAAAMAVVEAVVDVRGVCVGVFCAT